MWGSTDEVSLDEASGGESGGRTKKGETNAKKELEEDPFSYLPLGAYATRRGASYP